MELHELKPLEANPFKSKGDVQIKKIASSIDSFSKMMEVRKIVIDENNTILGGNKRYFACKLLGYSEIPDDWVKKVCGWSEEEKREFVIKDNAHWGSEWDFEMLSEWKVDLDAYGIAIIDPEDIETKETEVTLSDVYTTKVKSPIYRMTEDKPILSELYDLRKYNELMVEIKKSSISEDEKKFLEICARRHIVFNYGKIAEYYAHSNKEVQELMENSALVIIDFNKAIEKGFVKLYGGLSEIEKDED